MYCEAVIDMNSDTVSREFREQTGLKISRRKLFWWQKNAGGGGGRKITLQCSCTAVLGSSEPAALPGRWQVGFGTAGAALI